MDHLNMQTQTDPPRVAPVEVSRTEAPLLSSTDPH